jgi:hypothetical protein
MGNVIQKIGLNGKFTVEHYRNGKLLKTYNFPNAITNVGAGYLLDTMFNGQTQIAQASWSIGLVDNASFTAFALTDTMASHSGWVENIAYSSATRIAWGSGNSSARTVTNATAVTFNITGTATLQGVFISSNNVQNGTTGILWTEALFSSPIPVTSGDQIKISYSVAC